MFNWLTNRRTKSEQPSQQHRGVRLGLESLEERLTPIVGAYSIPAAMGADHWLGTGVVAIGYPGFPVGPGTGTLLSSGRHVLTAAHVVHNLPSTTVTFQVPGRPDVTYTASKVTIHPGYIDGQAQNNGSDLAVIELPEVAPSSAARHDVYRGSDEVGRWYYTVGFGLTGRADTNGLYTEFDRNKHWGTNYFDATTTPSNYWATTPPSAVNSTLLKADFDSDSRQWTGVGLEVGIASGDSGGPQFLSDPNRPGSLAIAGVSSFAGQGFGSYNWVTRVSSFTGWVDGVVSGTYDLTLDMSKQPAGNDGRPDAITADMIGTDVVVSVNGQVVHRDSDANVNSVRIVGSNDDDSVTVLRTSAGAPVAVYGRIGSNAVTLGAGNLDLIRGAVTIDGLLGSTNVVLRDEAVTFSDNYTVGSGSVQRPRFGGLNYASAGSVILNAQAGNNTFTLTSLPTNMTINGGGGTDTLVGPNASSTWNLNHLPGQNSTLGDSPWYRMSFSNVENLRGGGGSDVFRVVAGTAPINVDGQGGTDTLDYSAYHSGFGTGGVTVDLATGYSSAGGTITGVENVNGTAGDDGLYGNALANVLRGGGGSDVLLGRDGNDTLYGDAGRDLLFGGLGADLLFGGGDEDLLVASRTTVEDQQFGLYLLRAEWTSSRDYATRVANIRGTGTGPGSNGGVFLNNSTTYSDPELDSLSGEGGRDYFFIDLTSIYLDRTSDELAN